MSEKATKQLDYHEDKSPQSFKNARKSKAVPRHAMETLGERGSAAPTHS
jgi:hypothetical protein